MLKLDFKSSIDSWIKCEFTAPPPHSLSMILAQTYILASKLKSAGLRAAALNSDMSQVSKSESSLFVEYQGMHALPKSIYLFPVPRLLQSLQKRRYGQFCTWLKVTAWKGV